jgi:hypothetical protein
MYVMMNMFIINYILILAVLIKDEIRTHKWIESGKGRDINWEYAVQEWMDLHYDEFIKMLIPKSRIKKYLTKYSKDFIDFVKFITIP